MHRVPHVSFGSAAALVATLVVGCAQGGTPDAGPRPPLQLDGGEDGGAPDAGPMPVDPSTCTRFTCPAGMELTAAGDTAQCARLIEPRPSAARRFCHFLETSGVFGFSWTPVELVYNCPPNMEYSPEVNTGYCLYRDITPPAGVETACEDFENTGVIAFRFPCEL